MGYRILLLLAILPTLVPKPFCFCAEMVHSADSHAFAAAHIDAACHHGHEPHSEPTSDSTNSASLRVVDCDDSHPPTRPHHSPEHPNCPHNLDDATPQRQAESVVAADSASLAANGCHDPILGKIQSDSQQRLPEFPRHGQWPRALSHSVLRI
ncbi:hypothetical protein [Tuwongella immobilis]|uniref:hypothetical protein n=1 Tax=Tuwongella immobilis TaxID=692036 RepID=UPI0013A6AEB2|nr:hypothetical protein [Tuwongella immobilis]